MARLERPLPAAWRESRKRRAARACSPDRETWQQLPSPGPTRAASCSLHRVDGGGTAVAQVLVLRVVSDLGKDHPATRAFVALGVVERDRNVGNIGKTKGVRRRLMRRDMYGRRDRDFC